MALETSLLTEMQSNICNVFGLDNTCADRLCLQEHLTVLAAAAIC